MSDNVQIKVFFGIVLLAFFGAFYYKNNGLDINIPIKIKYQNDAQYQKDIDEAREVCAKEIDYKVICMMDYLVKFKGYSLEELNDYAISQEEKNK